MPYATIHAMSLYFIRLLKTRTALFFTLFIAFHGEASAKTVLAPITLDYPTLQSLVINSAFTGKGQTATPLSENDACMEIRLSKPEIRGHGANTIIGMNVFTRMGTFLMGRCVMPVEWEGYLEVEQTLWIEDNWVLRFKVADSTLFNSNREPATMTGLVWGLIKTYAHDYMDQITVNLAQPVNELKTLIPPMFPASLRGRAQNLVNSIRPGDVQVSDMNIRANIMMDIEDSYVTKTSPEKPLSENKFNAFISAWESLDSFLVYQLSSIGEKPLTADERLRLLDILIETRTEFVAKLTEKNQSAHDFTRKQFISAWGKLSPMLRNRFSGKTTGSILSYISFFTASDALSILDKAGPGIGIEISRNGLLRMARMLNEGEAMPLAYKADTSGKLRHALGLGAPLSEEPEPEIEEIEIEGIEDDDFISRLLWSISPATACAKASADLDRAEIKKWLVSKKNLQPYINKVRGLLTSATDETLKKSKLDKKYYGMYKRLVTSFAWQESCFRQFKVRKGKVSYLRSYNKTSVGLMQINERVWRGIYNKNNLRWNIKYNAMAGCEIIDLYIQRYALRKMKKVKPLDDDMLARSVYAMYNGGPGQFYKFIKRHKKGKYYLSDRLFWEKYSWVKNNEWEKTSKCLIGK